VIVAHQRRLLAFSAPSVTELAVDRMRVRHRPRRVRDTAGRLLSVESLGTRRTRLTYIAPRPCTGSPLVISFRHDGVVLRIIILATARAPHGVASLPRDLVAALLVAVRRGTCGGDDAQVSRRSMRRS
jgi:hypothetical protein